MEGRGVKLCLDALRARRAHHAGDLELASALAGGAAHRPAPRHGRGGVARARHCCGERGGVGRGLVGQQAHLPGQE